MYEVNEELSPCDITCSRWVPSREGDVHNFAYFCLFCWVSKIAFYSPNPHCCLGEFLL